MNKSLCLAQIALALTWARTSLAKDDRDELAGEVTALLDQFDAQDLIENMEKPGVELGEAGA